MSTVEREKAFLRALDRNGGGWVTQAELVRAIDGLGRNGARDGKLDGLELNAFRELGARFAIEPAFVERLIAQALAPAAPRVRPMSRPRALPAFFDFDSMDDLGVYGWGKRFFADARNNLMQVESRGGGKFAVSFLRAGDPKHPLRGRQPDAVVGLRDSAKLDAAFVGARSQLLTPAVGAFVAEKVLANALRTTASPGLRIWERDVTLQHALRHATAAPSGSGSIPSWANLRQWGGGGFEGSEDGWSYRGFQFKEGFVYLRRPLVTDPRQLQEPPDLQIAYGYGATSATPLPEVFRPLTREEIEAVLAALELSEVTAALVSRFTASVGVVGGVTN